MSDPDWKPDLDEIRTLLERAADYHDYQESAFDSIGEPELLWNVRFHEARRKAYALALKTLDAFLLANEPKR